MNMEAQKLNILFVDDEQLNLEIFKLNFSNTYNVFTATNGEQGLEILSKIPGILIVISDMRMPKMNGIEFIKKAKTSFPNIKYFILTGFELTSEIEYAIYSGLVKAYFKKPFNMEEIDCAINKVLV
jgi:response regulator RpfG family c-di-GMP phosphodiesterase